MEGNATRAFFNLLLYAVSTCSAFVETLNALLSTKNSQNICRLGRRSILNALNLKKLGVKIHNFALLLDFLALFGYTTHMPLFSRRSPGQPKIENLGSFNGYPPLSVCKYQLISLLNSSSHL